MNLNQLVENIVNNFMQQEIAFTALDVTNKVRETQFAPHSEIRKEVGNLSAQIKSTGYTSTTIEVTLSNGDKTNANLYHSLADSWDLDIKYPDSKRNQTLDKLTPVLVQKPESFKDSWEKAFENLNLYGSNL